jgi:hypothetical protein
MTRATTPLLVLCLAPWTLCAQSGVTGRVFDPQGKSVARAVVRLELNGAISADSRTDATGVYRIESLTPARYRIAVEAEGFQPGAHDLTVPPNVIAICDMTLAGLAHQRQSIVIDAKAIEPGIDLRNSEVFDRTLFTSDDQVMHQLNAGIDAGQHEGGGKSLEIRRFGFNLDHGGVNGGLKVLVDNVQQNQGTQGHGQGYLGALKALSPELIQDVTVVNGPFSAEYGDFSGLGVVHIRQRESLPDTITARIQGGSFNARRAFLAYSPATPALDSYVAYEGAYTDGPFQSPGRYRRDNANANFSRHLGDRQRLGARLLFGRNNFSSSGQLPLDLLESGALHRFGAIDDTNGGGAKLGAASLYYSLQRANGDTFKADAFVSRSLLDLYSNFTFYLNDPDRGDAFQQHDSRLQHGANAQYTRPHHFGRAAAVLVAGGNFHDNHINVGLYPREGRTPTGVTTRANAHVTNAAGYVQENVSFLRGRLLLGGGLRFDEFRYSVLDRVTPDAGGIHSAGKWQAKGSAAFTPTRRVPLTFTGNYGRGVNSIDARGVVQRPDSPRLAATDFYEAGVASNFRRFGLAADVFLIDHSHEQVYIADDGSIELKGPSRAYGYEAKASVAISRRLSLNGGLTKISNAFYRGGPYRVYVDSAPHFVANAALTLAGWRGWSGSLRMRASNGYRLDGENPSIRATGHTVFDLGVIRRLRRGVELNFSLDNLTNRAYYETQNYFESRVSPLAPVVARVHATPAFPVTAVVGLTFRLSGK